MEKYNDILEKIKVKYLEILNSNLVGIYVHGSIAFNCFNWEKSDIDFIVVVNHKLNKDTKLKLLEVLEELREESPKKGLEMSVVQMEYCKNFKYPTPYELHFSNFWLSRYLKNPLELCGDEVKTDIDLAAHFTVIKHVGRVLYGLPIEDVFGEVNKNYYIDSIKNDIESSKDEILDNPIYIILNLCRVLAYLKDNVVLSKEQGGKWGIKNLEEKYHSLIERALNCYSNSENMTIQEKEGLEFCDYMMLKINDAV